MVKKNEVATTPDTDIPAYLQKIQNDGGVKQEDNFDSSDVAIPQIKLLQGTSEQITDFDDARVGDFWHTGMDISLGSDMKFVVCSRRKKYLLQAPLDDGQGILARADDAVTWDKLGKWEVQVDKKTKVTWEITDLDVMRSGLTEWGTFDPTDSNESPPAATLFYEYLVIIPDRLDLGPAVISLARSAIKKAKKGLNDKISLHKGNGRPMQAIVFSAKSTTEQNENNQDYAGWQFTGAGFSDEDVYGLAVDFGDALGDYKVKDEGNQDAAPKPADSKGEF